MGQVTRRRVTESIGEGRCIHSKRWRVDEWTKKDGTKFLDAIHLIGYITLPGFGRCPEWEKCDDRTVLADAQEILDAKPKKEETH